MVRAPLARESETVAVGETDTMALSSMTGFARSHGASGPYSFEWELKSVNAKGFDLRLRLPQGWDELEAHAKKHAGEVLARGTVYANFNVKRADAVSTVKRGIPAARIFWNHGSKTVSVPSCSMMTSGFCAIRVWIWVT